jgi:hypothetical protein
MKSTRSLLRYKGSGLGKGDTMKFRLAIAAVLAASVAMGVAEADTSRSGASVRIDGAKGNVFAAGANVEISGAIEQGASPRNAVFAAGGSVNVTAQIDGTLFATGGHVTYAGSAKQVFMSGGDVQFGGSVDEEAFLAGGNLVVGEAARFTELHAAGASVDFGGTSTGDVNLAGAFVRLNGSVDGDVELAGEDIVIGPSTRVTGNLTYYATKEAQIDPAAQITGEISYKQESEREIEWKREKKNPFSGYGLSNNLYGSLFWFVALGASGILMALVFPRWFGAAAAAGRERPLSSLMLGFAFLIAVPVAAIIFMVMVIGLPFGGFLLALYVGLLCISMIGAGLGLGHVLFDRSRDDQAKILLYLAGLAILTVVGVVPIIGGIVTFFAMLLGLGVLVRGLWAATRAA